MGRPLGQAPASFKTEQLPLAHTAVPTLGEEAAIPARTAACTHTDTETHMSTQPLGCTPPGARAGQISLAIDGETLSPGALWEESGDACPRAALKIVREAVPSGPSSGAEAPLEARHSSPDTALFVLQPRGMLGGLTSCCSVA